MCCLDDTSHSSSITTTTRTTTSPTTTTTTTTTTPRTTTTRTTTTTTPMEQPLRLFSTSSVNVISTTTNMNKTGPLSATTSTTLNSNVSSGLHAEASGLFYFFSLFTHYKHESRSSIYLLVYTIWHPHHFHHYYTRSTLAFTINIYVFIHHQDVSTVDIKRLNKIIIYNLVTLKKQDLYYLLLYLHPISQIPVHDFCKCRPILIIFFTAKAIISKVAHLLWSTV